MLGKQKESQSNKDIVNQENEIGKNILCIVDFDEILDGLQKYNESKRINEHYANITVDNDGVLENISFLNIKNIISMKSLKVLRCSKDKDSSKKVLSNYNNVLEVDNMKSEMKRLSTLMDKADEIVFKIEPSKENLLFIKSLLNFVKIKESKKDIYFDLLWKKENSDITPFYYDKFRKGYMIDNKNKNSPNFEKDK